MHDDQKIAQFEKIIKYNFKNKDLLIAALTHPSYNQNESVKTNYQRLEFLGDAVLCFIITDILYNLYPKEREGMLAQYRSILIRGVGLAKYARRIELSDYIILSEAETKTGGKNKHSILEDVFEALIGAIYCDSNVDSVRRFINDVFYDIQSILNETLPNLNPKGQLQEIIQHKLTHSTIEYVLVKTSGPDHGKIFEINLKIDGKILGTGFGSSKKNAEEQAAIEALKYLKIETEF